MENTARPIYPSCFNLLIKGNVYFCTDRTSGPTSFAIMNKQNTKPENFGQFRNRWHEIIFEAETFEGRLFDIVLLVAIIINIIILMFESIPGQSVQMKSIYYTLDWGFTVFFTVEYLMRLYTVHKPFRYATSFFGIIDFLSIIPTYLSLIFPGIHALMAIRILRLLRLFRIFKLYQFTKQGQIMKKGLVESFPKILIFLLFVSLIVFVLGSAMFVIENGTNPEFDSIPRSIYWAIITVTTVGYGDISPVTPLGQFLASISMLIGYAILVVPTGIVTSSMLKVSKNEMNTIMCKECGLEGHDDKAHYCRGCGTKL